VLFSIVYSCAFPNTPKFIQVQQTRQGSIVNKQWIFDCHAQGRLLSEDNYRLIETNETTLKTNSNEVLHSKHVTEQDKANISKDMSRQVMNTFDDDEPSSMEHIQPKLRRKKPMATFDDDDDDAALVTKDVTRKTSTKSRPMARVDNIASKCSFLFSSEQF
jgi:hypothetical protein